jgi:hypothetical protein
LFQPGQAPADTAPAAAIETYKQRAQSSGFVSIPPGPLKFLGTSSRKWRSGSASA